MKISIKTFKKYKIQLAIVIVLLIFTVVAIFAAKERQELNSNAQTPQANIGINFTNITTPLAPYAFSGGISTYGSSNIITSQKQRDALKKLGLTMYRVPLRWNGGTIVSSAGGHPSGSGDAWVSNIRAIGAEPMIVIGGQTTDNNFTPDDAANLVDHFNGQGGTKATKVTYWVIGNEPNNSGEPMNITCDRFNKTAVAMRAVDPNIKLAGPALASYEVDSNKVGEYQEFLRCSGMYVDIVDFHGYGGKERDLATNVQITGETYAAKINQLREFVQQIIPDRASQIEIQVGEYNIADAAQGELDPKFYNGGTTVWGALAAGNIAMAGGRGFVYADQNNPLGLTFENPTIAANFGRTVNDPLPIYHGIGMFTGEKLFRKFGSSMVQATTTLPNVIVYASTNEKNIVVINKDPDNAQQASIQLTGFLGGTADVWQTDKDKPFAEPVKVTTLPISDDNTIAYQIPPYSVTTFVLQESDTQNPEVIQPTIPNPSESPTATLADAPIPTILPTNTPIPTAIPTATPTPSPFLMPTAPVEANETHGLTASYFANKTLTGAPVLTRIEPAVNLLIGQTSPYQSVPRDQFSVRWTGYVMPQFTERYTFYTRSDDGVRLWINGSLVINRWKDQSGKEYNTRINLSAGKKYQIVMEYYENYGDAVAQLFWSSPSTPKQIIPAVNLFAQ